MASWSGPQPTWHVSPQPMPQLIPCYVSVPPAPPTTGPDQAQNTSLSEETNMLPTSQLLQRIAVLETELRIERENKSTLQQTCNYLLQQFQLNSPQTPPHSPKRDEGLIRAHRKSVVLREKIRLQRTYIRHLKHTGNRTGDLLTTSEDNGSDQLLGLPTLSPASCTSSSSKTTALWDSGATTPIDRSGEEGLAKEEEQGHRGLGITAPEWKGKNRAPPTGREKQIPGFEPRKWIERRLRAATQAQTLGDSFSQRTPPLSGQKALNPSAAAYVMPERQGSEAFDKPALQHLATPILTQSEYLKAVKTSQANSIPEERLIDFAMSEGAENTQSLAKSEAAPHPQSTHKVHNYEPTTTSQGIKKIQDLLNVNQIQPPPYSPSDQSPTINHTNTEPEPNSPEDIELTKSILFYHPTPYDSSVYRTVIATNIPPTASPSEVMSHVCGGPVLSIRWMNTLTILNTNSALIIFVSSDSARTFLAYVNTTAKRTTAKHAKQTTPSANPVHANPNLRFAGIKYDLLDTPTFPPCEEEQKLIAGGRVTRCLSIRNVPTRIPLQDLRSEISKSDWQVDDGAVISIERGEDGVERGGEGVEKEEEGIESREESVVYIHISSLLAANRVFRRIKHCRRFGELEVRFERDVCDRPVPLVDCGEVEGVEKDIEDSFGSVEEDEGRKEYTRDEEMQRDVIVKGGDTDFVDLTKSVEREECPVRTLEEDE